MVALILEVPTILLLGWRRFNNLGDNGYGKLKFYHEYNCLSGSAIIIVLLLNFALPKKV